MKRSKKILLDRFVKSNITSAIGISIIILTGILLWLGMVNGFEAGLLFCLGVLFLWAKNSLVTDLVEVIKSLTGGSGAGEG